MKKGLLVMVAIITFVVIIGFAGKVLFKNHAPVGNADNYSVTQDHLIIVKASSGVLANDYDSDSDFLVAILNYAPQHGIVVLHPDGSFTYIPNPGYNGTDTFGYRALDRNVYSPIVMATIMVVPE